ncbi:MAG: SIS domain-containing protein [Alphaproteobacteria bacterium]|nr:SIS domain-containing protein [Alphaproteobacteria bacterium]
MSALTGKVSAIITQSRDNLSALGALSDDIARAAEMMIAALKAGRTIFFCGNGGSCSDAAHLAGELSGRFFLDRRGLPAIALGMSNAALTAIGNDFGYENVFSRELDGLARPGDVLIGISTSGNSKNVIKALMLAKSRQLGTIGFTGQTGGAMAAHCDICLKVPSTSTPRIQEMHIVAGHIVCELAEAALA